ncbi:MAG: hypothetical protein KJ697_01510 [Nanoarchaeota archaeon]|nr:hypothetical protein [Nanoarchaeota archaeon]
MVYIVKKNGKKEKFSKAKIIKACKKAGATRKTAGVVANVISKRVVEGMSARRIGELTILSLKLRDKKTAISFAKYFNKNWK